MSAICTLDETCYVTPYTTIVTEFSKGYSGTIRERKEKAINSLNALLGISAYPFKQNNTQTMEDIKSIIGSNGSNLKSFLEVLYEDSIDGYLDNEKLLNIFTNANKRVVEKENFTIDGRTLQTIKDDNNSDAMSLVSVSAEDESKDGSISSKKYPSDVMLVLKDSETNTTSIIYHAFNIGALSNKVNAQTEIAYQIFSKETSLMFLPQKEKEVIVNRLIINKNFIEASILYDKLINLESSNYNYLDQLIEEIIEEINKQIPDKPKEISQKLFTKKVQNRFNRLYQSKDIKRSFNKISSEETILDITNANNNVPFEIYDGLLLNISKQEDVIKFNFYTNSALSYAIVDKDSYDKTDWVTSFLDPNLLDSKMGLFNAKAGINKVFETNENIKDYFLLGYAKTSMNIANFDGDMNGSNTTKTKDYIVYRNKTSVPFYKDAPYMTNLFTVIDVSLNMMQGLSLVKNLKKWKKTQKALGALPSFLNNETTAQPNPFLFLG